MLKLKSIFRFLAIDWPSLQAITRKQKNLVRGISERGGGGQGGNCPPHFLVKAVGIWQFVKKVYKKHMKN